MTKASRTPTVLAVLGISIACGRCSGPQGQNALVDASPNTTDAPTTAHAGGALGPDGGSLTSSDRTGTGTASSHLGGAGRSIDGGGTMAESGHGGRAGSLGTSGAVGAAGGDRADGGSPRRDGSSDDATFPDAGLEGGRPGSDPCQAPGLKWHTGAKTNYTSYPDPGSEECLKYSGCEYEGLFSACPKKRTIEWVQAHNIVAVFPDFNQLKLHDLCLRSGKKTIVATVLDQCADSDCSGCCTENRGSAEQLIDVESFTDARWGIEDGPIEWADLGATQGSGCQ